MAVVIPKKPAATLIDANHVVTTERHLNVDATNGNVQVDYPAPSCGTNRTCRKVDDSANTVVGKDDQAATLFTLTEQGQCAGLFTDTGEYVVRGP
jgi:hypothetical protein